MVALPLTPSAVPKKAIQAEADSYLVGVAASYEIRTGMTGFFVAFFAGIMYRRHIMVVRMRHTKSQRNRTRSHHRLSKPAVTLDKTTVVPHLRHRASLVTGQYRGRTVIDVQAKLAKKTKKATAAKKEGR